MRDAGSMSGGAGSDGPTFALLQQARELGEEGDYDGMAERLREALEDDPDDPAVLCWLGVAERELGLDGVAYERFRRALAGDPEDPFILVTAGGALAHFDDPEAETALRTAALTAPDLPLARWMYGAYLAREGFHDDARKELDEARSLDREDAVIAYESGVAYALAGKPEAAASEIAEAVDLAADDGWYRVVLGLLLVELDRLDEALTDLDLGARAREDDVEAQLAAALAHGACGDEASAWEFLERGRMRAEGVDVLTAEAVEERLGDTAEAAADLLRDTLGPGMLRERLLARP
jgi:tetratricopeptide (TPR) repeat protein